MEQFWLQDFSFVLLLVMLFLLVFIVPILMAETGQWGIVLFNITLVGMFFSGIFSTQNRPFHQLASVLFLVHFVMRLLRYFQHLYSFYALENIVMVLNLQVFIYINVWLLFRDRSVNVYLIIGAINIYLLLALMGAISFEVINALTGRSIGGVALTVTDQDYVHFIYYSLVLLTTVGFGDLYPVSIWAKLFSVFLSAVGVLFPSIVIARLVGLGGQDNREADR